MVCSGGCLCAWKVAPCNRHSGRPTEAVHRGRQSIHPPAAPGPCQLCLGRGLPGTDLTLGQNKSGFITHTFLKTVIEINRSYLSWYSH